LSYTLLSSDPGPGLTVFLEITTSSGTRRATGILVDEDHVLTAAHALDGATSISVKYGYWEGSQVASRSGSVGSIAELQGNWSSDSQVGRDIAVFRLSSPLPLSASDFVGIGAFRDGKQLLGISVTAKGYPLEATTRDGPEDADTLPDVDEGKLAITSGSISKISNGVIFPVTGTQDYIGMSGGGFIGSHPDYGNFLAGLMTFRSGNATYYGGGVYLTPQGIKKLMQELKDDGPVSTADAYPQNLLFASESVGTEFEGTWRRDIMVGGDSGDTLSGMEANDSITGGDGGDQLLGGDGDDIVEGNEGDDAVHGDGGNDNLTGNEGDDTLSGGAGADFLSEDNTGNHLVGDAGADYLLVTEGANTFDPGNGNDFIDLARIPQVGEAAPAVTIKFARGDGHDWIEFGARQTKLTIKAEAFDESEVSLEIGGPKTFLYSNGPTNPTHEDPRRDYFEVGVYLRLGEDTIYIGKGRFVEERGNGNALIKDDLAGFDYPTLLLSSGELNWDDWLEENDVSGTLVSHEEGRVDFFVARGQASSGSDTVAGGSGGAVIAGLAGDDQLTGGNDADIIQGGEDNDTLAGGVGNDTIDGGDGSDLLTLPGAATDYKFTWAAGSAITVKANSGTQGTDLVSGVESVHFQGTSQTVSLSGLAGTHGTDGDDSLVGTSSADVLFGLNGNDTLSGGGGNDELGGETGGVNIAIYNGPITNFTFLRLPDGRVAVTSVAGTEGNDTLSGIDEVWFSGGTDQYSIDFVGAGYYDAGSNYGEGTSADNALYGLEGHDTLLADAGNDTLIGGSGDDTLVGGTGNDVFRYSLGAGDDTISEAAGEGTADKLVLEGINPHDVLLQYSGNDVRLVVADSSPGAGDGGEILLIANLQENNNEGVDQITFADGTTWTRATLRALVPTSGTAGDDTMNGTSAVEVLSGGTGNDRLAAGSGNDVYLYASGDGHDTIVEGFQGSADRLVLGAGLTTSGLTITRSTATPADALLTFSSGGSILLKDEFGNPSYGVEEVWFADGTIWSREDLMAAYLVQARTSGDDTIYGGDGAETISGAAGNDRLDGRDGDDQYQFNAGDGADTIYDYFSSDTDRLILGAGLDPTNLTIIRSSGALNDVTLSFGGSGSIKLLDQFRDEDAGYAVEEIWFANGEIWTKADLAAAYIAQMQTSGNDTIYGASGNETLAGLAGNDSLDGRDGSDVYVFNSGDGQDSIYDYFSSDTDILVLGVGLDPTTLAITRSTTDIDDVTLSFGASGSIFIDEAFENAGAGYAIEEFQFGDGTVWSKADLLNAYITRSQTAGNDSIVAGEGAETVAGLDGNDTLSGLGGADRIIGGGGVDVLTGGSGADRFVYEAIADAPVGSPADRISDFAQGSDLIDLSAIDADSVTGGDRAFTFIGTAAFSNVAGQLQYAATPTGARTIYGDVNGDGTADFQIQVTGSTTFVSTDFVL